MQVEPKHRKDKNCPVCYPQHAKALAKVRYARTGGYSPPQRCEAHQIKFPKPPQGKGAVHAS